MENAGSLLYIPEEYSGDADNSSFQVNSLPIEVIKGRKISWMTCRHPQ